MTYVGVDSPLSILVNIISKSLRKKGTGIIYFKTECTKRLHQDIS